MKTTPSDISFKNYKKNDIHGAILYPAMMVAPVQSVLLEKLFEDNQINSVFDPFHGSGTALYEAAELSKQVSLAGCDINPLANLITRVKLEGVSEDIQGDIKKLREEISQAKADNFTFQNIDKWFQPGIADSLRKIRLSIMQVESEKNRRYFWAILSNFIRRFSNTRSATYKLHKREDDSIKRIKNTIIDDFLNTCEKNKNLFTEISENFKLYKKNVLTKIKDFEVNEFDLTISSPPYGDNHTTVPYGQFSSLALYWIDCNDLDMEGWELDNYSIIDTQSLGGAIPKSLPTMESSAEALLMPFLDKIAKRKQKKVISFFSDYFLFLDEICRVTKQYIVLTLGNRTVDGVRIDLTEITKNYLELLGFKNIQELTRDIPRKRIPATTSKVNNQSVQSMNKEYVIIHKKSMTN